MLAISSSSWPNGATPDASTSSWPPWQRPRPLWPRHCPRRRHPPTRTRCRQLWQRGDGHILIIFWLNCTSTVFFLTLQWLLWVFTFSRGHFEGPRARARLKAEIVEFKSNWALYYQRRYNIYIVLLYIPYIYRNYNSTVQVCFVIIRQYLTIDSPWPGKAFWIS